MVSRRESLFILSLALQEEERQVNFENNTIHPQQNNIKLNYFSECAWFPKIS